MSTIRIEINPNLRLGGGDNTMVDLDEDVYGDHVPMQFEPVEVFERTSGIAGGGWVMSVDEAERTATVLVDWANLRIPANQAELVSKCSRNFVLPALTARRVA
jgi:hypothetical protein